MNEFSTFWIAPRHSRGFVSASLPWIPGAAAAAWFAVCCASVIQFGRFGFLVLARPSLYFGMLLFAASVASFALVPKPRERRDGFALALSLTGSAFTMISFAVASRLVG